MALKQYSIICVSILTSFFPTRSKMIHSNNECTHTHNVQYCHHNKNKKNLSTYFLSHPCKMTVVYRGISQYLQRNAGVVPRKGHDSLIFSPFQFTGKMELHLTHTMPRQVCMTVPKCTLFCVLESTSHHTIPPHSHTIFSTKLFPSWEANGRWVFVPHSKILIHRVLYITQ